MPIFRNDGGPRVGTVSLQYNAQYRCVRGIAFLSAFGPNCDGVSVYVSKSRTHMNASDGVNSRFALTPWVNDAGIEQYAHAVKHCEGRMVGYGQTLPY
jgi:hypothetical protein